jgi:hypothetical protein
MERETGIEPVASSLGSWRSTAELLPLILKRAYHSPSSQAIHPGRLSQCLVFSCELFWWRLKLDCDARFHFRRLTF